MFNGVSFQHDDQSIVHAKYIPLEKHYFENGKIKKEYLYHLYSCHTPCMKLYSRNFLINNNIRFPESIYGEDVEFWIKCLMQTDRINYLPYVGYMRRYRANSIMTAQSEKNIIDRINNIGSLLLLTKPKAWLHNIIIHSYIKSMSQNAIDKDRKIYRYMSGILARLSEEYSLDITKELVSVIIPVNNQTPGLSDTISSVLDQTHYNTEILIIANEPEKGSDNIFEIPEDERIHYHRLAYTDVNTARNYGINKAKGKFIAFLDVGNLWTIDHLTNCIMTLKGSGNDGLYSSWKTKDKTSAEKLITATLPQKEETIISHLLRTGCEIPASTLFATTGSVKDTLWDNTLNDYQEYDFVIRYCQKYKLTVQPAHTVICSPPPASRINFTSCIRVIETQKNDIEPFLYHNYNKTMIQMAMKWGAEPDIIDHYHHELSHTIEYLPLIQFLSLHQQQNQQQTERLKQEYIRLISDIEIEF